ncbi:MULTISPECIES: phosphatidate cytidylyltransferase [unclassified Flavobacterium]|uniref:phosphatidate cytidylyltransferase n=1 Tax=unclassified Flavobacterium TaxID=196869 RepID=UPI001F13FAA9|nr:MULTISPECIES: phosphatidate cytidylyltransferase [unclassified Flavobacterium]UMY65388.1 phosphatidate cytidylyltransferase [Flavobacterium sp. HJ-32-4]
MNKRYFSLACLLAAVPLISGCELAEGIFKAGVWVGVLVVVGIIALIVWIIGKARS